MNTFQTEIGGVDVRTLAEQFGTPLYVYDRAVIEKRIAEKEAAVAAIEAEMSIPGFFDDRARAEKAAKDREAIMWEVNDLMGQWELMQQESAPAS